MKHIHRCKDRRLPEIQKDLIDEAHFFYVEGQNEKSK